jgi:hypothetical protein
MLKAVLAAALLSGQAASVPAPTRCITRAEVGDLTLVSASVAVEVVRNACRSHLPTTAFLVSPAGADMPRAAIRIFIRGLLTEGAGADFAQYADAPLCRDANEVMEIASTLSPDQMARFVGAFASIADHVARMRPPRPALQPAPPETAPPTPHPAAFESAPTRVPPPVVIVPITPAPGSGAATRSRHRPLAPFLCRPSE